MTVKWPHRGGGGKVKDQGTRGICSKTSDEAKLFMGDLLEEKFEFFLTGGRVGLLQAKGKKKKNFIKTYLKTREGEGRSRFVQEGK